MRPLTKTLRQARNPRLLAASAATGVIVALVVAAFETVALHMVLERVLEQHLVVLALAPVIGIAASKLVLRTVGGGTSGSTSDEYVRAFHERHPSIPVRFLPAKLLAGVATIGSGGAVGLEGPSLYAGSSVGLFVHERLGRFFRRDEARLLLTAGAAAGVAARVQDPGHRRHIRPRGPLPRRRDPAGSAAVAHCVGRELRHVRVPGGQHARRPVPGRGSRRGRRCRRHARRADRRPVGSADPGDRRRARRPGLRLAGTAGQARHPHGLLAQEGRGGRSRDGGPRRAGRRRLRRGPEPRSRHAGHGMGRSAGRAGVDRPAVRGQGRGHAGHGAGRRCRRPVHPAGHSRRDRGPVRRRDPRRTVHGPVRHARPGRVPRRRLPGPRSRR